MNVSPKRNHQGFLFSATFVCTIFPPYEYSLSVSVDAVISFQKVFSQGFGICCFMIFRLGDTSTCSLV
nr:MAG TPA: hypothetical protein [Caudoviricetes sp.]